MFVIIQQGALAAYHQVFATEAEARAAVGKSHSRAKWAIYQLTPIATIQRSDEVVEIPA